MARCRFDGETLTYLEHGTELNIPRDRGLYEPSLIEFEGRYFLTLRADHSAYVTSSKDGLKFDPVSEWTFDDGLPLGSYNTQQHWVTCGGGLFLIYTRKGAENDHMFRHRAPLFIAQINPKTLQVIRETERVLIAENQATLGNSGVCRISDHESWVTCGEGLMRLGKRKGEHQPPFSPMYSAQIRSSRTFLQKQIPSSDGYQGHGGGDYGLVNAMDAIFRGKGSDSSLIENSIEGHLIGFAAEQSRINGGTPVELNH